MRRLRIVLCIGVCGLAASCGKPSADRLVPVSGTVTVAGQPLSKGEVIFVPDASQGNERAHYARGPIGTNGTFTLSTLQQPGAPPGRYRVMVLASQNEPSASLSWVPVWLVNEKYTRATTTDLLIEVMDQPAAGAYDLRLDN